jgi:hypothetical protein
MSKNKKRFRRPGISRRVGTFFHQIPKSLASGQVFWLSDRHRDLAFPVMISAPERMNSDQWLVAAHLKKPDSPITATGSLRILTAFRDVHYS